VRRKSREKLIERYQLVELFLQLGAHLSWSLIPPICPAPKHLSDDLGRLPMILDLFLSQFSRNAVNNLLDRIGMWNCRRDRRTPQ